MLTLLDNPIVKKILELVIGFLMISAFVALTYYKGYEHGKESEITLYKAQEETALAHQMQKFKSDTEAANELALQTQQAQDAQLAEQNQKVQTIIKHVHDTPEYKCDNNTAVINNDAIDEINKINNLGDGNANN